MKPYHAHSKLPSPESDVRPSPTQRMRERLAKGGEVARGVLREIFPQSIWLQADASGKYFWAVFADDVGQALVDFGDFASQFPLEPSDASLGKVGESGSGGVLPIDLPDLRLIRRRR